MQEIFAISGFINFLVSLVICLFVFVKRRNYSNIIFALLTFSTALWSFGYWRWLSEYDNYSEAIFWLKFLTVGSVWIPGLFANWTSSLSKEILRRKLNRV